MSGYGGYEYEAQNGDAGGGGYAGGGGFLSQSGASQGDKGEKKVRPAVFVARGSIERPHLSL